MDYFDYFVDYFDSKDCDFGFLILRFAIFQTIIVTVNSHSLIFLRYLHVASILAIISNLILSSFAYVVLT